VPKTKSKPRSRSSSPKREKSRKSHNDNAAAESGRSLRPYWSGTLSFGLVSVPVDLYPATRNSHVGMRMLGPDGTPLARRFFCPDEDKELSSDDLVRGYEYKPDKYVKITDEELEALEPKKSRDIDLQQFVDAGSIDPVYFDRSFFLMPAGNSGKAYHLLAEVMERSERAGIATFVLREREYLVAIFARDGILTAEALRFHDEVRGLDQLGISSKAKADSAAVKQYSALLAKQGNGKFDLKTLHDEHTEALRELASKKAKKKQDVVQSDAATGDEAESDSAETVDLMRMLKQSLKAG
jgi:DNA end-binding protein Ku